MHRTITVYCRAGGPRRPVWFCCTPDGASVAQLTRLDGAFAQAIVCRRLGYDRRAVTIDFRVL